MELLPHAFLFRFAVPVPYAPRRPKRGTWPVGDDLAPLPLFSELDSPASNVVLRAGWNEDGFGLSLVVSGKNAPPQARADDLASGDGLHVWIDTRNTQGAHRASRFCHRYAVLPAVGRGKSVRPVVAAVPIAQSREANRVQDLSPVRVAADMTNDGYRLEVWFPAETLYGYDGENSPRLGFHVVVKDAELGDRSLTVGDEFPTDHDPSLWTTLELTRSP
jgi:hypothetical protein